MRLPQSYYLKKKKKKKEDLRDQPIQFFSEKEKSHVTCPRQPFSDPHIEPFTKERLLLFR